MELEGVKILEHVGTQHIIELNGRRYDATTGKMLPRTEVPAVKAPQAQGSTHSIDGFVRQKAHAPRKVADTNIDHHPVAKSGTLMRKVVSKPTPIVAVNGRHVSQNKTTALTNPLVAHVPLTPPAERIGRAEKTKRSSLIQRFGSEMSAVLPNKHHQPTPTKAPHIAIDSVSLPISDAPSHQESALAAADSHTQPKLRKTPLHHRVARKVHIKPRTLSVSAAVMAFVVLGGFFAYQSAPNLSMMVASRSAKVEGSLPGYKPSGFALSGPIKYQPGEIIVSYKSNSDDRKFQITQRGSAWDTESLRENYVIGLKTPYQAVQEKGKTIYLFNESSATWVDGGVWYEVSGDSKLNTEQVLDLANSF